MSLQLYDTANKYHIYHSLALLGAARCRKPALVNTSYHYSYINMKLKSELWKLQWLLVLLKFRLISGKSSHLNLRPKCLKVCIITLMSTVHLSNIWLFAIFYCDWSVAVFCDVILSNNSKLYKLAVAI